MPLPEVRGVTLTNAFAMVLDDFRSSYVLHFTPTGVPGRGFHTLRVEVRSSGRVDVRARSGYTDR